MDLQEVELHHRSFKALGQSCENTMQIVLVVLLGFARGVGPRPEQL